MEMNRRQFAERLAQATGAIVLLPALSACATTTNTKTAPTSAAAAKPASPSEVPLVPPESWDPIAYNRSRGLAGAIPESYHASITAEDGPVKHLGKHLPYVPDAATVAGPDGHIAIMWGDPSKGHAKHPNASRSEKNPEGHWYNWIRIRKATAEDAIEAESRYSSWPTVGEGDNGSYVAAGGGEVSADGGKNTVYLAALPSDVKPGDTVRVYAHCLTHGEYVDFLTV